MSETKYDTDDSDRSRMISLEGEGMPIVFEMLGSVCSMFARETESAIERLKKEVRRDHRPDLRDQFAMAALTGLLSSDLTLIANSDTARECYGIADVMLAARERTEADDKDLE